jgi:segregation and condensation protein B
VLRYYELRRLFFCAAHLFSMSLKAKLEAVVYAAEEPVTLAHLATIFAEEVLHGLAETASQETEAEQLAPDGLPSEADAHVASAGSEAPALEETFPEQALPPEAGEPMPGESASAAADTTEGDEKKLARQRDRQVRQVLQLVLDELIADYTSSERGMEIREVAGGYRMATKPEYHDAVRGFVKSLKQPMKLSLQALETLAVIAYKQPVTAPEVSEIRGVDSGGVLGGLVSRKLITTAGRKQVIGRPILYKTTKEFLLRFGLKDVNDLPSMEEFEKMAGELAESEAAGEVQDASMRSADPVLDAETPAPLEPDQAEEENPAFSAAAESIGETAAEPQESEPQESEPQELEHPTLASTSGAGER